MSIFIFLFFGVNCRTIQVRAAFMSMWNIENVSLEISLLVSTISIFGQISKKIKRKKSF